MTLRQLGVTPTLYVKLRAGSVGQRVVSDGHSIKSLDLFILWVWAGHVVVGLQSTVTAKMVDAYVMRALAVLALDA
jgi:hypothetical protein